MLHAPEPGFAFRTRRAVFLAALALLLYGAAACGGGGSSTPDGDSDLQCPPCYAYNNGQCVPIPGCGADGDVPDGDKPDGDKPDGDGSDGDTTDSDGSDGDIFPDGDIPTDGDTDGDRDYEVDHEIPDYPEQEEGDGRECIFGEDWMCGVGRICTVEGLCIPDPSIDGDADLDEQTLCPGGQDTCSDHDDCPRAIPCDTETGCCSPGLPLGCEITNDCPFGMFCSGLGLCDYRCLSDSDCDGAREDYCADMGICLPPFGDEDEEEIPPCVRCTDCIAWFGPGYFCHQGEAECMPKPPGDSCCEHGDCVAQPNGVCNLQTGLCAYFPDYTNRGLISGTVFISPLVADWNTWVTVFLYDMFDQRIATRSGLKPFPDGSNYSVRYAFTSLPEGTYSVSVQLDMLPGREFVNPFNPIGINYSAVNTTLRENVDFYIELSDPRLATISGSVRIHPDYQGLPVDVEVYRDNPQTHTATRVSKVAAGTYVGGVRPYYVDNITNGSYFVRALMREASWTKTDYYSALIPVEIGEGFPPEIEDVDLYFGVTSATLGRINGYIVYTPPYLPTDFSVYLYAFPSYPYPVAQAVLSMSRPWEVDFSFHNVEPGTYWILAQADYFGQVLQVESEPSSVDIEPEIGTIINNVEVIFDLLPDPDGDWDEDEEWDEEDEGL